MAAAQARQADDEPAVRGVRGTNKRIMKSRWVGEMTVRGERYRFRSTNRDNVVWWLRMMSEKHSDD